MCSAVCGVVVSLLLSFVTSCSVRAHGDEMQGRAADNAPAVPELSDVPQRTPYPYAAWRIADQGELDHVVLWVSHILIRFDGGYNKEVSFNLSEFYSVLPAPTRSRGEALALAQEVSAKARRDTGSFGALARQYSEDLPTKEQAGSLGGVTASQLSVWPQVLDALSAVHPGEASEVVETWYGFHIFYRSPPPPEETLSGAHIVIAHDDARWLRHQARGQLTQRSREEALALATQVYEMAKSDPQQFDSLVERYSEHRSTLVNGDFGSYSSREPKWCPREAEVLSRLQAGDVAAPIDSPVGFEIIKRTPNRTRQHYAMDSLWLSFDPAATEDAPTSRASVLAQANALLKQIGSKPERLESAQKTTCCAHVLNWEEGRETPGFEKMLDGLAPGEISSAPIESAYSWVIGKRLEPTPTKVPLARFELPTPEQPDIDYHLVNLPPAHALKLVRRIGDLAGQEPGLKDGAGDQLRAIHQLTDLREDTDYYARRAMVDTLLAEVRRLLNAQQHERYLAILRRELKAFLLDPANSTAIKRLAWTM